MKNLLVVFSHGKESGPWGSKIQTLAKVAERLGAQAMSVDYRQHPAGTTQDPNAPGEADRRVGQAVMDFANVGRSYYEKSREYK